MHSVVLLLLVVICYSTTQSSPTLHNPTDCIISCIVVLHHLPVCSNSDPLGWWWHPKIWSSVIPFSSCPQSLPASEYFPMSWLFISDSNNIGVSDSASGPPVDFQDWFSLGLTGLISLQSKGLTESSPRLWFKSINSLMFSLLYGLICIGAWLQKKTET